MPSLRQRSLLQKDFYQKPVLILTPPHCCTERLKKQAASACSPSVISTMRRMAALLAALLATSVVSGVTPSMAGLVFYHFRTCFPVSCFRLLPDLCNVHQRIRCNMLDVLFSESACAKVGQMRQKLTAYARFNIQWSAAATAAYCVSSTFKG